MSRPKRIYLDHAATSWPKSEAVLAAMDHYQRDEGASAGRGSYASAVHASACVSECRRRIANLIGAADKNCISFHSSGTAALNAAIHGLVRPGDHVVTTAAEHNSVLRPLKHLENRSDIELTIAPCDNTGRVNPGDIVNAVRPNTRLVAVTHVSNVTGVSQPIEEIGNALGTTNTIFLCDAAQSFGYIPIDVSHMKVDLLAAPGHKGGAGPFGTALLYCSPKWHSEIHPTIQGGTGSQSESLSMPDTMPEKLEAGNLNVAAIAGWNAGLAELTNEAIVATSKRGAKLSARLHEQLSRIPNVNLFGSPDCNPVVSLTIDGMTPSDISAVLDIEYSIETRAGFHCAALIHQFLGTRQDGTLRISAGRQTSNQEMDAVIEAIKEIAMEITV